MQTTIDITDIDYLGNETGTAMLYDARGEAQGAADIKLSKSGSHSVSGIVTYAEPDKEAIEKAILAALYAGEYERK